MPESTIAEKITKIRKMNNLERSEFATIIKQHLSTVQNWEVDNIVPTPESINNICIIFDIDLYYFAEYYYLYFNPPTKKIILWKNKKGYTNNKCCEILDINYSTFSRLINERISLSYSMYIKLRTINIV